MSGTRCDKCGGTLVGEDFVVACVCKKDEVNNALAKAIVDEFFKRLPDHFEFRTYHQAGDAAEVYGNYVTILSLVEEED